MWVTNTHATSTQAGDMSGAMGNQALIGHYLEQFKSATKSMHEYLLGGAGAYEAVNGVGIATANGATTINLIRSALRNNPVASTPGFNTDNALSNSFGFGTLSIFAVREKADKCSKVLAAMLWKLLPSWLLIFGGQPVIRIRD